MKNNVEEKFNLAANYIQSHHHEFSKENLLKFYAFYKQSTSGELDKSKNSRPSFFKIQERAKYDAWAELSSMTQAESMQNYIELLTKLAPQWCQDNENNSSSGSFGVSVSRPKVEEILDSEKTIEDFIKEGNIETFKKLLNDVDKDEINSLDENGLGLIHWASDRGNHEILNLILQHKDINVNLKDNDGQTALFYASSCGHVSCLKLLIQHNADKNILDNDGCSCLDVAYDDDIKGILK
jgi:acyl-CoA-binding protein